jgi:S1-C subfamily serine protease
MATAQGGSDGRVRYLQPLGDELSPQARQLADALRELFEGLGVGVRRYASRIHLDGGTVSRYLNGTRTPPWQFVEDLFRHLAEKLQAAPTACTMEHLRKLHDAVLDVSNSPVRTIQLLENQLARADQEARRAELREQALVDALQAKQHRIADLEVRLNLAVPGPRPPSELTTARPARPDTLGALHTDHARLLAEAAVLREELDRERELHQQAEARCEELEDLLAAAEARVHPADGGTARGLTQVLRARTVMTVVDGRFMGSGTLIDERTVLTCAHVVWGGKEVQVNLLDRQRAVSAKVTALYPPSPRAADDQLMYPFPDLAVLRLDEPVDTPAALVSAAPPVAGDSVPAGGVSARSGRPEVLPTLLRVVPPSGGWVRYSNNEMSPGMEGGPLLDLETGNICGLIRSSGREATGGLVIPSTAFPTDLPRPPHTDQPTTSWWLLTSGE